MVSLLYRFHALYRTVYCGPNGVLIIDVPLYRTVYCDPNGVLNIEVSLYRTVYCGPNGVLIIEASLYYDQLATGHRSIKFYNKSIMNSIG